MKRLLMLSCSVLALTGAAHAADIALLPHVPDNATLSATKSTAYDYLVRDDVSAGHGATPLMFKTSNSACPLNAGAGDVGSQVPSRDGNCWFAVFGIYDITPDQFGAPTDGVSDATVATQAAATAAAGRVFQLGPHLYCVSSSIVFSPKTEIFGVGRQSAAGGPGGNATSGFRACAPNMASILTVDYNSYLGHFFIDGAHAGANTSGTGIKTAGTGVSNVTIEDVWVDGSCIGEDLAGNTVHVVRNYITNQIGAGCGSIRVGFAGTMLDVLVSDTTISSPIATPADYGVLLLDARGGHLGPNNDFIGSKINTKIAPGAGQQVIGVQIADSYASDTSLNAGLSVDATSNTAVVTGLHVSNSWFASSKSGPGVSLTNTGSGTVEDISLSNTQFKNNWTDGIQISANVGAVKIVGSTFCGNSEQATGTFSDILLNSDALAPQLVGNKFQGACPFLPGSTNTFAAVSLADSTTITATIVGNDLTGPTVPVAGTPIGGSVIANNTGLESAGFPNVASAATIALNAVYPRWAVTGITAVTTINNFWNGRTVWLWTISGAVAFNTGGNICNSVTSAGANAAVLATYTGTCWLMH